MTENVGEFVYNKKDLIGHGAFAVVFKGRHRKKDDFVVAIKVIAKKNLSKTQNLLAKEIKILKELHHENVVSLFDCQETSNNVFLVMEHCNGGDLADYLREKGTLSEDTIHIFLRQIASAMSILQSKGVVHRDLKPQNLLLHHTGTTTPSPSQIKIKIADFGFARFLPGEMMAATLCGSPMYMAPEVIMSKAYDAKADLWSMGTIIYQCLTGKAPFQANSPQALKKFYEKNKQVYPNIPAGTSHLLKDLLVGLLKRNSRERLDFGEFFSHPFLTGRVPHRISTPVAVPNRQRKNSGSPQGTRSPSYSPNFGAEALGDIRVDLLHRITPPYDQTGMSPQDPPTVINISSSGNNSGTQFSCQDFCSTNSAQDDDLAVEGFVIVPSNPDVPGLRPHSNPSDPLFPFYSQSPPRTAVCYPQSPSRCRTPQRAATFTVGSPYSTSPVSPPMTRSPSGGSPAPSLSSTESSPVDPSHRKVKSTSPCPAPSSQPSSSPLPIPRRSSTFSEGVRVSRHPPKTSSSPTQHVTVTATGTKKHQPSPARRTLIGSPCSLRGRSQDGVQVSPKHVPQAEVRCPPSSLTAAAKVFTEHQGADGGVTLQAFQGFSGKNGVNGPRVGALQRALSNIEPLMGRAADNSRILTALAQTNIGLGVPITSHLSEAAVEGKQIVRVHSSPASLAMGLQRKGSFLTSPAFQLAAGNTTPMFRRNSCGSSSSTGRSPPLSSSPAGLPTIPGSPTKTSHSKDSASDMDKELKPLRGLFTVGSSSPGDSNGMITFGGVPGRHSMGKQQPAVVNQGTKVTRGFVDGSLPKNPDTIVQKQTEVSSPHMEGPIALIAPELPEDTLMETEHTDGVRKLNFVLSLVEAILEVITSRATPLSILTDSVAIKQNESFLADQVGLKTDEFRKIEQLVLYVKALRALNLALLFAQEEIRLGHLKPSNAVKNVLNKLNNHYRCCLEKASQLKQFVEPGLQNLDGKAMTISADRLMYHYAMELCQNAALDELFGNPKECKKKYETAQFLLQGLEEEAHNEDDRCLLQKYKVAVDKRLECLAKTRLRKSSRSAQR